MAILGIYLATIRHRTLYIVMIRYYNVGCYTGIKAYMGKMRV
jgi:hypothetical protein